MKTAVILGCGPAGLFAAQAVSLAGLKPIIISRKRKSEMHGAQYLHRPIPGLSAGDGFQVEYQLEGTEDEYREKVYGLGYRGPVSPDELIGEHTGWDIRAAYQSAWMKFQDNIQDLTFDSAPQVDIFMNALAEKGASHFISTIPAPALCFEPGHSFSASRVWGAGDAPERGLFVPITAPHNTVVCSGSRDTSWYRKSNILGYNSVEWPENKRPPIDNVSEVLKPISTNCDCLPFIHRVGRYGRWTKGVLSDSAFYDTFKGITGKDYS